MPGLQDLLGLGDLYGNMTRAFGRPRLPVGLADADDEGWEEDIGGRPVAPRMPAVRGLQKTLLEQMMGREGYMGSPEQYSMLNPEMAPAEASQQSLQRRMDVEDWAVAKPLQRGYVDPTHERELAGLRRVSPVPAWERDRDATWNLTGAALRDRALQKGLVMPQGGGVPQTDESKDLVAAARASQVAQQTAARERAMRSRSMASAFRAGGIPLLALQMQGWGGGGGGGEDGGMMNPIVAQAMGLDPRLLQIQAGMKESAADRLSRERIAEGMQSGENQRTGITTKSAQELALTRALADLGVAKVGVRGQLGAAETAAGPHWFTASTGAQKEQDLMSPERTALAMLLEDIRGGRTTSMGAQYQYPQLVASIRAMQQSPGAGNVTPPGPTGSGNVTPPLPGLGQAGSQLQWLQKHPLFTALGIDPTTATPNAFSSALTKQWDENQDIQPEDYGILSQALSARRAIRPPFGRQDPIIEGLLKNAPDFVRKEYLRKVKERRDLVNERENSLAAGMGMGIY